MLDEQVLRAAVSGNDDAIVAVLHHYKTSLYRVAYSYLRNEHDAVDAWQELSYRCFRSIGTVKEPQYIGTWLTKMMMNICRDMLRKRQRELPSVHELEGQSYEQGYDIEWLDALEALDEQQRELIILKYVNDQSNAAIAREMNVPEGTVKSRLYYTLRKLRGLFGEER